MTQVLAKQGRGLLALLAVLAIAVAACGSSSASAKSSASASSSASAGSSSSASAKPSSSDNGGGLGDAGSKFSNISSYKFTMTILDESITGSLSSLTGGTAGDPMTFSGTVVVKPEAAADVKIGTLEIIEVGGKQYMDLGSGTFISTPIKAGDQSIADSFSPATMFESFVGASQAQGYGKVGSGQKNGVSADHYTASQAALAEFAASQPTITGATWTSDVWISADGGYPVSFSAIATKDSKAVWEVVFEVLNVNDATNKVTAPAA